jgi:SAM-dependent methyltransferase
MVERATARFGGREGVSFAVDDAERLSLPDGAVDVVSCSFGLMYCYDARAALSGAARVLRPGGRMLQVVWGPAKAVWFVPVIELIETRAAYFSAVCPMMFFYGLPGVLPRMIAEAGMEPGDPITIPGRMRFADAAEAVDAAVLGGPLAGLFVNRLDAGAQAEVREALTAHVESLAERDGAGISLPRGGPRRGGHGARTLTACRISSSTATPSAAPSCATRSPSRSATRSCTWSATAARRS